jgi:hypothetical protein
LPEIGEAGQARLEGARVRPCGDGFSGTIEARYLRAAGIVVDEAAGEGSGVSPGELGLHDASAREVGEGALRALVAMRAILGVR